MKNQLSKREYKYKCKIIAENHLKGEEQMKQIITRYRKSPYELAKYTMGDIWNNLHWYQKLYYRIYCEWIRRMYK